ncbi:YuzD family protein [Fictibacillus sp. KIGAM418]|uniref:YuzD family protein n=1 Tax=Fictibacillus marinisediminis TaxID=2878389 RepID=A0A9X2BI85_9BACL|nr:YuzD family protein [Fictibacillus marinisediminis]MCK6258328.1 YuzD family protein [Fictibacillus marinisediminis]
MDLSQIIIKVFGGEQKCASCVNLPTSKETAEWLEAAISRKFPDQLFSIEYVDIFSPTEGENQKFVLQILEEDLFYPVVVINNEIVAEGNPRLKDIYEIMEQHGYRDVV